MNVSGRTAIVTGGGSGLGAEISRVLGSMGAEIVVADIHKDNAASVSNEINVAGGKAISAEMDVYDGVQVKDVVAKAHRIFGKIDILVTSAGIGIQKPFLETTLEEWERIVSVNMTGAFLTGQACANIMVEQRRGRIINIASVAGLRGVSGRCAYGASKGGLISLTQVMASELGPHGITVNAVAPGPVETALTKRMHTKETQQAYIQAMPVGRYGTPAEVANLVAFLASDEASYITGQSIAVDGGMVASGPRFSV